MRSRQLGPEVFSREAAHQEAGEGGLGLATWRRGVSLSSSHCMPGQQPGNL